MIFVLEGPDGCGKSTQIKLLKKRYGKEPNVFFLKSKNFCSDKKMRDKYFFGQKEDAYRFLFLAQNESLYMKALDISNRVKNPLIFIDRGFVSFITYQETISGGGWDKTFFDDLGTARYDYWKRTFENYYTIYLYLPLEDILTRLTSRGEKLHPDFEKKEILKKVVDNYQKIMFEDKHHDENHEEDVILLNGFIDRKVIHSNIVKYIEEKRNG